MAIGSYRSGLDVKLTLASICDFAQVREGLLFIASGNITSVTPPAFPGNVSVMVAVSFTVDAADNGRTVEIKAELSSPSGESILTTSAAAALAGIPDGAAVGTVVLPLVVSMPSPGRYAVTVSTDSAAAGTIVLPLDALPPPE